MKVLIIGGGASGLMAALSAAEDGSNRVMLLERQGRVGRKLLATGNGRCNLTNLGADASHYHGAAPEFVKPAFTASEAAKIPNESYQPPASRNSRLFSST